MNDEQSTPELLPCPFCGGEPYLYANECLPCWFTCPTCNCEGPHGDRTMIATEDERKQSAIEAWSRRFARTLTAEQVERARILIPRLDLCLSATSASQSAIDRAVELLREILGDV